MFKKKARALIAGAALAGAVAVVPIAAQEAQAGPYSCATWWAFVGGNQSSGTCKAPNYGGTWFRVGQQCGWLMYKTWSPWTWAPAGRAASATTAPCPSYSQKSRTAWVET